MRKAIFLVVLAVSVTVAMIIWFIRSGATLDIKGSSMMIIQFVVLAFAIVVVFRRSKSAKQKLPAEDEMSKSILRRGAATSYYVSLYMWIAFMYFEDSIKLERYSLIGAGIIGMAIIFGLSWVYHSYIKRNHD
jgi:peptidoglycan/LPS O-acetylase OafA/YrhL